MTSPRRARFRLAIATRFSRRRPTSVALRGCRRTIRSDAHARARSVVRRLLLTKLARRAGDRRAQTALEAERQSPEGAVIFPRGTFDAHEGGMSVGNGQEALLRRQKVNRRVDRLLLVTAAGIAALPGGGQPAFAAGCLAVVALLVWWVGSRTLRHYDAGNGRGALGDIVLTAMLASAVVTVAWIVGSLGLFGVTHGEVVRLAAIVFPSTILSRWAWVGAALPVVRPSADVLVIGVGPHGRQTTNAVRRSSPSRRVTAQLRWTDEKDEPADAPILGTIENFEAVLRERVVDEVYFAWGSGQPRALVQDAIHTCERLGVPFALPLCGFRLTQATAVHEKAFGDGYMHYACVRVKPVQLALKRTVDIAAAGCALLVLSPFLALAAASVKLTSRGPVLFRQERVGLHGRHFHMLKFRSMVANAEALKATVAAQNEQAGPVFKMARDPRVTALGRFLRKYSIDELPQLVNVLRGDMSIVGPRPPLPSEVARYEGWQHRRLSVRPGLTCVWQVSGRNAISFEQWMLLDLGYIDHWNLVGDLSLILKTVPVVLSGRGAS